MFLEEINLEEHILIIDFFIVRQGSFREYLPPSNTQKPRPFQPSGTTPTHPGSDYNFIGYPPSGGITPQPPFPVYTNPATGGFTSNGFPSSPPEFSSPSGFEINPKPFPTYKPPSSSTGYPNEHPKPGFPIKPPASELPGFPQQPPGIPGYPGIPTQPPGIPGFPTQYPEIPTLTPHPLPGIPTQPPQHPVPGFPTAPPGQPLPGFPIQPPNSYIPPKPTLPPKHPGYPSTTLIPDGCCDTTEYPHRTTSKPIHPTITPIPEHPTTIYPIHPGYPSTQFPPSTFVPETTQSPHIPVTHPSPTIPPLEIFTQPPIHPPTTPPQIDIHVPTHPPTEVTNPSSPVTYPPPTHPPPTHPPSTHPPPTQPPPTHPSPTQPPATHPPPTGPHPTYTNPPEIYTSPHIPTTNRPKPDENTILPGDHIPIDSRPIGTAQTPDEELKHPPHIHAIDVECAKDMMTINIEFNRQFDGVIYSKGFYHNPECRYVKEHSGQTKYSFTVSLHSCGTQFINAFDTQGQSYLENVLVLQNEPGIQEVWDTIRSVRCLWEGNLNKALSVALSVGMLNQEIVTFSGDTAMARLDIQLGKGPFAPNAHGLVKIGEVMTLVVSVTGDPGFDIQVKDCRARDSTGDNEVALTDHDGCILKPKLFGAFQKTRHTGNTGASIIAYAFFNAFKFPDVMDLMIECNVELCKTDCEVCPDPHQKIDPGRRRKRDLENVNNTIGDPITIGKMLRVILPEDLNDNQVLNITEYNGICMSTESFLFSSTVLISLLTASCLFSAYVWLKHKETLQKN